MKKLAKNLKKYVREALLILSLVFVACECPEDDLECGDVECVAPEFDECDEDGNLRAYTGFSSCDESGEHVYCEFEYNVIDCGGRGCTVFEDTHDHCNVDIGGAQ